jgi:hypothetical protein
VIATFEKLTGLGETATIAPCRVGAAAAPVQAEKSESAAPNGSKSGNEKVEPPRPSPEIVALRQDAEIQRRALVDVCRSLDQLAKTTNAQKLFAFHALARSTEEDIRQTRSVLTGFEEVLGRLGVAHAALASAGQTTETIDIKALLGTISELVTRLGALQAALAEAKK